MAIAGSTFDAKSNVSATVEDQGEDDSADPMSSGGALAPRLREWLAREATDREINPLMARALSLACVAADLDTGNVGDAFLLFCEGARRLCEEREMRAGRSLGGVESGKSCIDFLLSGQARYVFNCTASIQTWVSVHLRRSKKKRQATSRPECQIRTRVAAAGSHWSVWATGACAVCHLGDAVRGLSAFPPLWKTQGRCIAAPALFTSRVGERVISWGC